MNILSRPALVAAMAIALGPVACSDDSPTGSGGDTTPPALVLLTPVDEYHIDVTFSEGLATASAEKPANYQVYQGPAAAATTSPAADPGDPLYISAATLGPDGRTVSLTTWSSMSGQDLMLTIDGVTDTDGNAVAGIRQIFLGSAVADDDPPRIVRTTPAFGSADAPIRTTVVIQFSEPIDDNYIDHNLTWTTPSGPVRFYRGDYYSSTRITIVPIGLLEYDMPQTLTFSGFRDRSGNIMPDGSVSFRTTNVVDRTPPRLVSSYPANLATDVDVNTHISLTFSEPIDRFDFDYEAMPWMLLDDWEWSDGGRTITMRLREYEPLSENRQYTIALFPGGVFDLAGNTTDQFQTVIFTTGSRLESGSIKGRVAGHPGTQAADPAGTLVFAETWDVYNAGVVGLNDSYVVSHLDWGGYYVSGYMDSNRDGYYSPFSGDAFGGYGADLPADDWELQWVPVLKSRHVSEVDFRIFDASAAFGAVTYAGGPTDLWRPLNVGLFTTREDALALTHPVAASEGWWPYDETFLFNSLYQGFDEGDYYLAAYIDVDSSGAYEPDTDLSGAYGGTGSPTALHMVNGRDYFDLTIAVGVPVARSATRVTWPAPARNPGFQRLADRIEKSQPESRRLAINAANTMRSPHEQR